MREAKVKERAWTPQAEAFYGWAAGRIAALGVTGRVVDIGCGTGKGTRILHNAGLDAYGLDNDSDAVGESRSDWKIEAYEHHYERSMRPKFKWEAAVVGNLIGYYGDPVVLPQDLRRDSRVVLLGGDHPAITPEWYARHVPGAICDVLDSGWLVAEVVRDGQ